MDYEPLNDSKLILSAQGGNKHAIDTLCERCFAFSYKFLRSLTRGDCHLSEDLAQETCVKFFSSLQTLKLSGAKGWVGTTAYRAWVSAGRKKRPTGMDMSAGSGAAFNLPSREPAPDEQLTASEIDGPLGQALQQLPPRQQELLILRFWGGLSADEMSTCLGISVGMVHRQTYNAYKKLRKILDPDAPESPGEPDV